ncbi:MAG: tRNA (adenosine(37)-N6)-threonylcarbamoyltransferase complex dimerization subunit type 1 TsaB [Anditalea sp.]
MGLILSIETATSVCSVAVHQSGILLGMVELYQENVHGQKLMPVIDALFKQVGITGEELDAVAVTGGPGSYTGLRIGASTAKGLAFAKDIPLIAVDTLDALALRAKPFVGLTDFIIPMMDARRMEVYCKVLDGEMRELVPLVPKIIDETSFDTYLLTGKVFFLGDSNKKVSDVVRHENAVFVPYKNSASSIGEIAALKFENGQFEDLAYFEPNYLKEFRVLKSKKSLLS